jgi:hypothetical protein
MTLEERYAAVQKLLDSDPLAWVEIFGGSRSHIEGPTIFVGDVMAAVRALCHAVLEDVFGVGWDEELEYRIKHEGFTLNFLEKSAMEEKAAIDALGQPVKAAT